MLSAAKNPRGANGGFFAALSMTNWTAPTMFDRGVGTRLIASVPNPALAGSGRDESRRPKSVFAGSGRDESRRPKSVFAGSGRDESRPYKFPQGWEA